MTNYQKINNYILKLNMSKLNEKLMVESFLNLNHNIKNAQDYIKENYHINSEYDSDEDIMYIWGNNINENLNLASAKEYIINTIGSEMVNVIYGKRQ